MTTTTLPSFVELMASLGLDNDTRRPGHRATHSFSSVSSSSSASATSSLRSMSTFSTPQTSPPLHGFPSPPSPSRSLDADRRASLGRKRAARFSPYWQEPCHTRRVSLPGIRISDSDKPSQAMKSAPSSPRSRTSPSSDAGASVERDSRHSPSQSDNSDAPLPRISSMARARRTPSTSPRSATFRERARARRSSPSNSPDQLLVPVALPTLPPMIMPTATPLPSREDSPLAEPYSADSAGHASIAQRRQHRIGLRISTFRSPAGNAEAQRNLRVPIHSAP
ncbi:hypothetical protein AURDEDRAFT_180278 [Auricularia subglabra TFB-10046 SS5]|nr:hypothetical protein AURDEDRAFT_180278 [Auricularia subglabra TFB-10046 SS5]